MSAAFDEFAELDDAELDVVAEDEALADGLASAAWAIAEPPPTRTPEIARVIADPFRVALSHLSHLLRVVDPQSSRAR